jgi:signal transduction histidine kinase
MRSLRTRLTVWFGLSFLVLAVVFALFTHALLEEELRHKTAETDYPTHPDWKLHGSYSEAEVDDILHELMQQTILWSAPLVVFAAFIGYWLARQSLRPIASVNRQLEAKNSRNLGEPIILPEVDSEFRGLLRQLNDLLTRLNASFYEMNNYAAKVAHELRTPLAILRLKVEQSDGRIRPELAEELQAELHRLTYVVDQSLLIARAERGSLKTRSVPVNLTELVKEVVEDFQLLAAEEGRRLLLVAPASCWAIADVQHVRQIIHGLLSNALKHGEDDLRVRVNTNGIRASLSVANRVTAARSSNEPTLGLGLRVIGALLRLEPNLTFHRRFGRKYHVARLTFPSTACPFTSGADGPQSVTAGDVSVTGNLTEIARP